MSNHRYVLGLVVVAGLLTVLGLIARSGDYDIVAMMRTIHQATTEIGDVNGSILTSLGSVRQEVEKIDAVQARLVVMEGLIDQQIDQLERLATQTGHQAELSVEMQHMTAKMVPPVDGMARTATNEAELLGEMHDRAVDLSLSLRSIAIINRTIAEKLKRAEQLAALVLSRMP